MKLVEKWRNEAKSIKHYDLLKLVLDESGYSATLKNKIMRLRSYDLIKRLASACIDNI